MALRIITATERLAASSNKATIAIFGPYGVGKTSLLHTLDPQTTLCCNIEAGMKSVQQWPGDTVDIKTFEEARDLACLFGGPNPALREIDPFSTAHYEHVAKEFGGAVDVSRYRVLFWDSISDLTHLAMAYAKTRPEAYSEKTGKEDLRGAYGIVGRETINLLRHVQHAPGKDVVFVGRLERVVDDFNREVWQPQMEGSKAGRELPGIVDQVVTMSWFDWDEAAGWRHAPEKGKHRALVCQSGNPWGLPAKDRSGNLEQIEEPHLGKLLARINQPGKQTAEGLQFGRPDHPSAAATANAA